MFCPTSYADLSIAEMNDSLFYRIVVDDARVFCPASDVEVSVSLFDGDTCVVDDVDGEPTLCPVSDVVVDDGPWFSDARSSE